MQFPIQLLDPRERLWRGATIAADRIDNPSLPGRWECDLADGSVRWSLPIYELFGIAPGTPIDRRAALELYESESRSLMERLRAKALNDRGSFTMEAQICRGDGAMRWMRLTADTVCRDGRATHLYGTKQDITQEMAG